MCTILWLPKLLVLKQNLTCTSKYSDVLYPPAVTSVSYFKMSLCLEQWLSTFLVLQPSLSYLEVTYVVMNPNYKLIVVATS